MSNFSCKLFNNLILKSPLILASGISGNSDGLLVRAAKSGAAAVTTKGVTLKYQKGAENPVSTDWGPGLITNLGLSNPGIESMAYMIKTFRNEMGDQTIPIFVNIHGESAEEYAEIARLIAPSHPDLLEIDLPFPDETLAQEITHAVIENASGIPISVKISADYPKIGQLAKVIEDAGADAISAINSMKGLIVDAYAAKPFLSSGVGGISGPAIKPIALYCISEIYQAVNIPIIGTGGVLTGLDMAEMMMAGATIVGVGSALYYSGYGAFSQIMNEFETFMKSEGYQSTSELVGKIWR